MSLEKRERIRAQAAATRFEREIALKGQSAARVVELLDYSAFFRLFKLPLPMTQTGLLEKLAQRDMIQPRDANYDITNLGALLFAQNLGDVERLGRQAIRLIFYQGRSKVRTLREVPAPRGYAPELEGLVRTIGNMLPANVETKVILREQTAPSYPPGTERVDCQRPDSPGFPGPRGFAPDRRVRKPHRKYRVSATLPSADYVSCTNESGGKTTLGPTALPATYSFKRPMKRGDNLTILASLTGGRPPRRLPAPFCSTARKSKRRRAGGSGAGRTGVCDWRVVQARPGNRARLPVE